MEDIKIENIEVYYQPIVDTKTLKVLKYEALARYKTKNGEMLNGYQVNLLLPKMEQRVQMFKVVFEQVIKTIQEKNICVSVNISYAKLTDEKTQQYIIKKIQHSPFLASRLSFELLENQEIKNPIYVNKMIEKLRKYEIKVGLDDFGTLYSNYEALSQINFDFVKIDSCLITKLDTNKKKYIIVKHIVKMLNELSIPCVAEFVETQEILDICKELNINMTQGYLISEPKPIDQF